MKYLDKTGLAYFLEKVKAYVQTIKNEINFFSANKLIVRYDVSSVTIAKADTEQTLTISKETVINGINDKTTYSGTNINILEDMTIELNGTVQPYNVKGSYITIRIYQNGTQVANARFKPASSYEIYSIPIFYVQVSAGDVLQIRVLSDNTAQQLNAVGLNIKEL